MNERFPPSTPSAGEYHHFTPRFSSDVSDYGVYDVSSLEKDITAVVCVSFFVE